MNTIIKNLIQSLLSVHREAVDRGKFITLLFFTFMAVFASGPAVSSATATQLVVAGRDGIYGQAVEQTIGEFNRQHPLIRIELRKLAYDDLYRSLVDSFRGKSAAYDVVLLDDAWATEFMQNGWLQELRQIDPDFVPAPVAVCRFPVADGKLYAVPFSGNVLLFAYRTDLFRKSSIDQPKTWSDVVEAARVISHKNAGVDGVVFRGASANPVVTGFLPIFWAYGGTVLDSARKARLESRAGKAALDVLLRLKDFAPPGVERFDATDVQNSVKAGKAAMAIEAWSSWLPALNESASSKAAGKIKVMLPPGEVKGPSPMLGIWQLAIPTGSDHPEEARLFIDFITDKRVQRKLALELAAANTCKRLQGGVSHQAIPLVSASAQSPQNRPAQTQDRQMA